MNEINASVSIKNRGKTHPQTLWGASEVDNLAQSPAGSHTGSLAHFQQPARSRVSALGLPPEGLGLLPPRRQGLGLQSPTCHAVKATEISGLSATVQGTRGLRSSLLCPATSWRPGPGPRDPCRTHLPKGGSAHGHAGRRGATQVQESARTPANRGDHETPLAPPPGPASASPKTRPSSSRHAPRRPRHAPSLETPPPSLETRR